MRSLPLSLFTEPGGWDENGIVVTVVGVLGAPFRLALLLHRCLPRGLRPPAASWRFFGRFRFGYLGRCRSRGPSLQHSLGRGWNRGGAGAGGVAWSFCDRGRLTPLPRGLGGSWGEIERTHPSHFPRASKPRICILRNQPVASSSPCCTAELSRLCAAPPWLALGRPPPRGPEGLLLLWRETQPPLSEPANMLQSCLFFYN